MKSLTEDDIPVRVDSNKDLRMISLYGIQVPAATTFRDNASAMAREDPSSPITLVITSYGGDMEESIAYADAINMVRKMLDPGVPIIGLVSGTARSAATFILQHCDLRQITSHSNMMVHGDSTEVGTLDQQYLKELTYVLDLTRNVYIDMYTARTHKKRNFWERIMADAHPRYLSADGALSWGLVDVVLPSWKP